MKKGSQILLDFGRLSNAQYLSWYGIVNAYNPYNTVQFEMTGLLDSQHDPNYERKKSLLHSIELDPYVSYLCSYLSS